MTSSFIFLFVFLLANLCSCEGYGNELEQNEQLATSVAGATSSLGEAKSFKLRSRGAPSFVPQPAVFMTPKDFLSPPSLKVTAQALAADIAAETMKTSKRTLLDSKGRFHPPLTNDPITFSRLTMRAPVAKPWLKVMEGKLPFPAARASAKDSDHTLEAQSAKEIASRATSIEENGGRQSGKATGETSLEPLTPDIGPLEPEVQTLNAEVAASQASHLSSPSDSTPALIPSESAPTLTAQETASPQASATSQHVAGETLAAAPVSAPVGQETLATPLTASLNTSATSKSELQALNATMASSKELQASYPSPPSESLDASPEETNPIKTPARSTAASAFPMKDRGAESVQTSASSFEGEALESQQKLHPHPGGATHETASFEDNVVTAGHASEEVDVSMKALATPHGSENVQRTQSSTSAPPVKKVNLLKTALRIVASRLQRQGTEDSATPNATRVLPISSAHNLLTQNVDLIKKSDWEAIGQQVIEFPLVKGMARRKMAQSVPLGEGSSPMMGELRARNTQHFPEKAPLLPAASASVDEHAIQKAKKSKRKKRKAHARQLGRKRTQTPSPTDDDDTAFIIPPPDMRAAGSSVEYSESAAQKALAKMSRFLKSKDYHSLAMIKDCDRDRDDALSTVELTDCLRSITGQTAPASLISGIFRVLDSAVDDTLDTQELFALTGETPVDLSEVGVVGSENRKLRDVLDRLKAGPKASAVSEQTFLVPEALKPLTQELSQDETPIEWWKIEAPASQPLPVESVHASINVTENEPEVVWINAFARSGSSALLALVSLAEAAVPVERTKFAGLSLMASGRATVKTELSSGRVFAIFEPCDGSNVLGDRLRKDGCEVLVRQLLRCNFSDVYAMNHWEHDRSLRRGVAHYEQGPAVDACKSSKLVAYKTINITGATDEWEGSEQVRLRRDLPELAADSLRENSRLRLIDLVRDPRAIFASWVSVPAFAKKISRTPTTMLDLCDAMERGLHVESHPRLKRVVYEDFVQNPRRVGRDVYNFLGLSFGLAQTRWIDQNFNSACGEDEEGLFKDCHSDSQTPIDNWRNVLTPEEVTVFSSSPSCQKVLQAYSFPAA